MDARPPPLHPSTSEGLNVGLLLEAPRILPARTQNVLEAGSRLTAAVGLLIAAIYVVLNYTLSRLAVSVEARSRRTRGSDARP